MENLYLAHYGTKGQKWGVRRYQKKLGALNDKYGPKVTQTTTSTFMSGLVYVDTYIRNLIGGKKVRVESYSYDLLD